MYSANAAPRHNRTDGEVFQKSISTNKPNTWLMGENSLKKLPGLTALKYSLVVAMELGISLPQDFASTKEV
jgi:hypothetical protein